MPEKKGGDPCRSDTVLEGEGVQDQGAGDEGTQDQSEELGNSTFAHIQPPILNLSRANDRFGSNRRAPRPGNSCQPIQGVSLADAAPDLAGGAKEAHGQGPWRLPHDMQQQQGGVS